MELTTPKRLTCYTKLEQGLALSCPGLQKANRRPNFRVNLSD